MAAAFDRRREKEEKRASSSGPRRVTTVTVVHQVPFWTIPPPPFSTVPWGIPAGFPPPLYPAPPPPNTPPLDPRQFGHRRVIREESSNEIISSSGPQKSSVIPAKSTPSFQVPLPTEPLPDLRELLSIKSKSKVPAPTHATTGTSSQKSTEAVPHQIAIVRKNFKGRIQTATTGPSSQKSTEALPRPVAILRNNFKGRIQTDTTGTPSSQKEVSSHLGSRDTAPIRKPTRPGKKGVVSEFISLRGQSKRPFESTLRKNSLKQGDLCKKCVTTSTQTEEEREKEIARRVAERVARHNKQLEEEKEAILLRTNPEASTELNPDQEIHLILESEDDQGGTSTI